MSSLMIHPVACSEISPFSSASTFQRPLQIEGLQNDASDFPFSMRKLIEKGKARFLPAEKDEEPTRSFETGKATRHQQHRELEGRTSSHNEHLISSTAFQKKQLSDLNDDSWAVNSEEALRNILNSPDYRPRFPVVYRYYGRKQALPHSSGSVPFLLLGPNVDHWKVTGQELSNRGYNAVACERVLSDSGSSQDDPTSTTRPLHYTMRRRESALLILQLLDALRWNKAVLVACDSETLLAIEAAMQLAPLRIAGVVLCGRLPEKGDLLPDVATEELGEAAESIDEYLEETLRCPFMIVWDGAIPPLSIPVPNADETAEPCSGHRCLVLGAGSAPHRRRPELLAWALTRFVEKQVSPPQQRPVKVEDRESKSVATSNHKIFSFRLNEVVSPGTLVVAGRVMAKVLFYVIVLKSALYQYENVRWGMGNLKSGIERLSTFPARTLRLFKVSVTFVPRRIARYTLLAAKGVGHIPQGISSGFRCLVGGGKWFFRACLRDARVDDRSSDDETIDAEQEEGKEDHSKDKSESESTDGRGSDELANEDTDDESAEEPSDESSPRPWIPNFILDQVVV